MTTFEFTDFDALRNRHFPTGAMVEAMRQALPAVAQTRGSTQAEINRTLVRYLL